MPYGLQFADEPELIPDAHDGQEGGISMGTKPNATYRKDTDDYDA